MAPAALGSLLRYLRRFHDRSAEVSDGELLRQHLNGNKPAFDALLRRHAPMVWGVCRRLLDHEQDAEDAFQAVFLVLLRKAESLREPQSLAAFLHGVASHIAQKARATAQRRRCHESRAETPTPSDPFAVVEDRDLRELLDEELDRLPEKYRAPLVLCYLEGLSYTEAARQLGWRDGTVCGRLARARELLRQRLSRRGLTLSGMVLVAALSKPSGAPATTSAAAVSRMAALFALGQTAGSGVVSVPVATLAQGVLQGMSLAKLKAMTVLVAIFCILASGAGLAAHWFWTAEEPSPERTETPTPNANEVEQSQNGPMARTDRYGDPLPPGAVARLGTVRLRHPQIVNSVAFTPDGKLLASAGSEGTIRAWEPATGKELRRFEGGSNAGFDVAFSPDGSTMASACNSGLLRVWEMSSGKYRFSVIPHEGSYVACVAFSPDGKWLASGGGGNRTRTLSLWDVATGKEIRHLGDNMRTVKSVAFSPNGKFLAAASDVRPTHGNAADREGPGVVRLWDATTGKLCWEKEEETGGATSVAFAPDGKTVVSAGYDSAIHIRDVAAGKEVHKIQVPEDPILVSHTPGRKGYNLGGILALAFAPDGKLLTSAGYDGAVRLWNTMTWRQTHVIRGHSGEVTKVAFSPDGKILASCSKDQTIRLWDPANGELLNAPVGHDGPVSKVAVFPDGKRAASAGHDRTIRLWDLTTGQERAVLRGHRRIILSLLISPDGKTVVSGSEDGTVRLWDVDSGNERSRILGAKAGAYSLSVSPDGKLLAWACGDRPRSPAGKDSSQPIGVAELASGREIRRMAGGGHYYCVRFSPCGKWLAAYAHGHGVDLWEVATGKRRHIFGDLIDFAFLPNTETLVGWCKNGEVRFHSLVDGRDSGSFAGPNRPNWVSRPFATTPDGRTLLFVTEDNIQLWETASGRLRRTFSGHASLISDGVFAPDCRTLLSASSDSTILVWDVARQTEQHRGKLGQAELQSLWQDMAGKDAVRADRAIWTLAARAEQAVPFLRKCLEPIHAVEPSRLRQLVADLDSDQFAVRDKATRDLEELSELAESALRKMLAAKPSLEARRRVEELLTKLYDPLPGGERLRAFRAVEVLEHAGTEPARRLLIQLASGAPEARLTREARVALQRLTSRKLPDW